MSSRVTKRFLHSLITCDTISEKRQYINKRLRCLNHFSLINYFIVNFFPAFCGELCWVELINHFGESSRYVSFSIQNGNVPETRMHAMHSVFLSFLCVLTPTAHTEILYFALILYTLWRSELSKLNQQIECTGISMRLSMRKLFLITLKYFFTLLQESLRTDI